MKMYLLEYKFGKDGKLPYIDVTEKAIIKYGFKRKPNKYKSNTWVFELSNGNQIYEGRLDKVSNYSSYTMDKSKVKEISKGMLNLRIESGNNQIKSIKKEIEEHKKALEELK